MTITEAPLTHKQLVQVLADPFTPAGMLVQFVDDESYEVRAAIGGNPSTPRQLILQLLNDRNPVVRASTAHNPAL